MTGSTAEVGYTDAFALLLEVRDQTGPGHVSLAAHRVRCRRELAAWLTYHVAMTASRDELIHLIEGMPDDQVDALLADAKRMTGSKRQGTWPPRFVGMIKDGPANGSSPEYLDAALARGSGGKG